MSREGSRSVLVSLCAIAVTMLLMGSPLVGAAGASATQVWGTPVYIDRDSLYGASFPELAIDARGDVVAVWTQMDASWVRNIWANRCVPGTGWGTAVPIQSILGQDAALPCVAMDPGGNATVVWKQQGTRWDIWATRYVAGVGWEVPMSIETSIVGDADWPEVGVDRNGNALAVWSRSDGAADHVMSSRYVPGVGWGMPMPVESSLEPASMARLAVGPDGNAMAVWHQFDGTRWNVWSNRYVAGSGWGTAVPLETSANPAGNPDVAVDAKGNATAVWTQSDGTRDLVWASLYRPGSGWQAPVVLQSDIGQGGIRPIVEFDSNGNAMAVWIQSRGAGAHDLWTCRYVRGVGWDSPHLIETGDTGDIVWKYEGVGYDIAFDTAGDAMVVWSKSDGTSYRPWACRYVAGAGWESPSLMETTIPWDSGIARVVLDSGGTAVAVWEQMDGSTVRMLSSRYLVEDDTPPVLTLTRPSEAVVNTTTVTVAGVTEPGAHLVVNGIVVAVSPDGSFSVVIALSEGANTITAVATDAAGNKATVTRTVTYVSPTADVDITELEQELQDTKEALDDANARIDSLRSMTLVGLIVLVAAIVALQLALYWSMRKRLPPVSPPPPESQ